MSEHTKISRAFVAGYHLGTKLTGSITREQATALRPSYGPEELDAYVTGADDGRARDGWRAGLAAQSIAGEAVRS